MARAPTAMKTDDLGQLAFDLGMRLAHFGIGVCLCPSTGGLVLGFIVIFVDRPPVLVG